MRIARATRVAGPGLLLALLAFALPSAARCQIEEALTLGLTAARTEMRMSGFGVGDEELSGVLYGVEGEARIWRAYLSGEYRQGRLRQNLLGDETARAWSVRGRLGVFVLPWVVLAAGPSVSTVGGPLGDRQVVRWRVEALGEVPLVPDLVRAYASISGSVAGTEVQKVMPLEGGAAEAGVVLSPRGQPLWARMGYRIEDEYLGPGWGQTVETAYLSVGITTTRPPRD